MSAVYLELAERIKGESQDLTHVVERALQSWSKAEVHHTEQSIYVESVALNLHAFYTGIERLFELIARHVDRKLSDSEMWHRDLIQQMASDNPEVRPAVISSTTAGRLDEFRRFRHLVRNAYSFDLEPAKMKGVITTLSSLWTQLHAELIAFASFLEALGNQ